MRLPGYAAAFALVFASSAARAQDADPAPPPAPIMPAAPPPPPATAPAPAPAPPAPETPFSFGDFTWMNGQSRQKDFPLKPLNDIVTLSLYLDVNYGYSLNHPRDDTFTGSASVPRHNEFNINLASVGLEWNYRHVIGRLSLQYGSVLSVVQDQDGTVNKGRNMALQNLRYIREATTGYHFDWLHGVNVEGGIFMSYMGLESYLLAENWNYTRSVVCENTPFYFQGMRIQVFTSDRFKIEPWIMNGWQTYGKWNLAPSVGMQLRYIPFESLSLGTNFYLGTDTKGVADRIRFHNDHSIMWRYFQKAEAPFISKMAVSVNNHIGFEAGGQDILTHKDLAGPAHAHMVGTAVANRFWFAEDKLAFTIRGELFSNPSRYLSEYPPPGFTPNPNNGEATSTKALQIWGVTGTFDVMPTDFFAFRIDASYRRSNLPFYAGPGGTTSPDGYQPTPEGYVPDLVNHQTLLVASANFRL